MSPWSLNADHFFGESKSPAGEHRRTDLGLPYKSKTFMSLSVGGFLFPPEDGWLRLGKVRLDQTPSLSSSCGLSFRVTASLSADGILFPSKQSFQTPSRGRKSETPGKCLGSVWEWWSCWGVSECKSWTSSLTQTKSNKTKGGRVTLRSRR